MRETACMKEDNIWIISVLSLLLESQTNLKQLIHLKASVVVLWIKMSVAVPLFHMSAGSSSGDFAFLVQLPVNVPGKATMIF